MTTTKATKVKARSTGPAVLVPLVPPTQTLLTLDVSSTACGWAYWDRGPGASIYFGVIRPPAKHENTRRIDWIVEEVERIVRSTAPEAIVLEWSDGRQHARLGKVNGLSVLGAAQGAVRQVIRDRFPAIPLHVVGEQTWTGRVPKKSRAAMIARLVPAYTSYAKAGHDRGADAADAIGLGLWAYRQTNVTSPGAPAGGGA
jgi:Holliday junction resolvasome RuvABC endonuclease subunit